MLIIRYEHMKHLMLSCNATSLKYKTKAATTNTLVREYLFLSKQKAKDKLKTKDSPEKLTEVGRRKKN